MTSSVTLLGTGASTIPVSGPGVKGTVTITDSNCSTSCSIIITRTSNTDDGMGPITLYVSAQTAAGLTVTASRQVPTAITFDYVLVEPAVA